MGTLQGISGPLFYLSNLPTSSHPLACSSSSMAITMSMAICPYTSYSLKPDSSPIFLNVLPFLQYALMLFDVCMIKTWEEWRWITFNRMQGQYPILFNHQSPNRILKLDGALKIIWFNSLIYRQENLRFREDDPERFW